MNETKSIFWKNHYEGIVCLAFLLMIVGCINIFSASQVAAQDMFSNSKHYLYRHLIYACLGMFSMFILSFIDYKIWLKKPDYLAIGMIFLLAFVIYKGVSVKGAQRWIELPGGVSFQPSEFAKMSVILISASVLGKKIDIRRKTTLLSAPILWTLIIGYLVYIQPDLGTAAIIVGLTLALYFICGLPKRQYLLLLGSIPVAVAFFATKAAYRAERIQAWFDPWSYADRIGYQAVQSMLAIGSGGLLGVGFGQGSSKFYYLPEAHTDFAFAILCQEWGFVGALCVIFLFSLFGYILWQAATLAPDGGGYLIVMGCNLLIVGQAVGNIAMVCGLLPVIGVPLPFISYGGTSLLVIFIMLGIVLNVIRQGRKLLNENELSEQDAVYSYKRSLRLVK